MKNSKLKLILFEGGMSQRDLAKKSGVHESTISLAINGKYNLDEIQKAKIAKALKMSINGLFEVNYKIVNMHEIVNETGNEGNT